MTKRQRRERELWHSVGSIVFTTIYVEGKEKCEISKPQRSEVSIGDCNIIDVHLLGESFRVRSRLRR